MFVKFSMKFVYVLVLSYLLLLSVVKLSHLAALIFVLLSTLMYTIEASANETHIHCYKN
jgi:hypothetical protein